MFCTRCKKEYTEEHVRCPECGKKLADLPEGLIVYEAMKPVKVASASDAIEAGLIMNLLLNNGIPSFKKDNGPGGLMNVKYGFSVFGEEIYVDEGDYQKASDIIKELSPSQDSITAAEDSVTLSGESYVVPNEEDNVISNKEGNVTPSGEDEEDNTFKNYPFYRNPHILARIFLISQIVIAILVYLLTKLHNK